MRIQIYSCVECGHRITDIELSFHEGQCPECGNSVSQRNFASTQKRTEHAFAQRAA